MLGQIASIIGMVLTIASFQMKTRKQIIAFQTVGSTFFLLNYLLLENDYLRATFLSQFGGKLYSLFDKLEEREHRPDGSSQPVSKPLLCSAENRIRTCLRH